MSLVNACKISKSVLLCTENRQSDLWRQVAGNYVAERLDSWDPQAIANIVWAYAKMEVCHDPLMTAVANNLTGIQAMSHVLGCSLIIALTPFQARL